MVILIENEDLLGVKISGDDHFEELKDCLKDHEFAWKPEGFLCYDKIWVEKIDRAKPAIKDLLKIEEFEVTDYLWDRMTPKLETKKYRIPYKKEYLASEPIAEYQERAIKKASKQTRLLLAHKQGLGKSYMIISAINHIWNNGLADKILVVCPTESVYNFRREILRFAMFPVTKDEIYIADVDHREPFQPEIKIVIAKYRTFLMLSDNVYRKKNKKKIEKEEKRTGKKIRTFNYRKPTLPLEEWGTNRIIVVDESHSIKELKSRQTKILHLHKKFFKFRYELSGTPWPTGVKDLYSQMTFLDPNLIPMSYRSWIKTVANIGTKWSDYEIRNYRENDVKQFMDSINDWIIREFVEDNVDIPEQYLKRYWVPFNRKHRALYKSYISYKMQEIKINFGRIVVKEVYRDFPNIMLALDNPCILQNKRDKIELH